MRLHEFLSQEREQLIGMCAAKLRARAPGRSSAELLSELPEFIDEVIAALRRGITRAYEDLAVTQASGPGAELGKQRKEIGFDLALTALSFGVVSDSVGELGANAGLSFEAADYRIFDQCLDEAMASALTAYWNVDRARPGGDTAVQLAFFAHELRNALSGVQMAWTFLAGGNPALQGRTAKVLERNLQRALDLIAHTILGAQLTSGAPLTLARVNVERMLLEISAAAVSERNVSISVVADSTLEVDADERILVSAVNNLLQNAIKFTHDNGAIEVRATGRGGEVYISVEDQCGGLPPGDPTRLFDVFVRGSEPRSTGLGLAIARQGVRAHGGDIEVQDLPGRGCVFSIHLPHAPASHTPGH